MEVVYYTHYFVVFVVDKSGNDNEMVVYTNNPKCCNEFLRVHTSITGSYTTLQAEMCQLSACQLMHDWSHLAQ